MIGWFSTAVIGAFRSALFQLAAPTAAHFFVALSLLCFLIMDISASGISIPLSLLMLLSMVKSYVNRLFDPACVPMWITINKLYLVPKRMVPGVVICWIWASQMSQSCSFILLHRSFSLTDVNLAAFIGNSVNNAVLFSRVGMVFWLY